MSDYLSMISSLDREINDIIAEYGNEGDNSEQTIKNVKDSTKENIKDSTEKNVVNVASKNFVSAASSNVIQSPFLNRQQKLKSLTLLRKGDRQGGSKVSEIVQRISVILKF